MKTTHIPQDLSTLEHSPVTYITVDNWITKLFKGYLRENAFSRRFPSFWLQYRLMKPLHHMLFPFTYIKTGDTCVQVGCAEWMFDFGVSMTLIMSAIVGKKGKVIVVEPDQKNIDILQEYMQRHHVHNIEIVKKAAWKEKGVNTFTFYDDRTSTNVITEVEAHSSWKDTPEYQNRKKRDEEIEMDTLDNIFGELGIQPDFVNLTINGAEFGAIQGMSNTLKHGVKVAWLFGNRSWWVEALHYFEQRAYDVIVTDAAYSHRAPTVNGKASTYSYTEYDALLDVMYGISIPKKDRIIDSREFPAMLYKKGDFDFIVESQ